MSWSVGPRRLPLPLALAVAMCLALVALPGPARADFPGATTPNGQTGRVGGCYATAGPNYLGLACPGGGADTGPPQYPPSFLCKGKVKGLQGPLDEDQLKSCQEPPTCYNSVKLNDDELRSLGFENTEGPDGITYYWQGCLRGISKDLADRGGTVTQSPEPRPNSSIEDLVEITPEQQQLVDYYFDPETGGQSPPTPSPLTSPNLTPRVRTDVSFYDGTPVDPDDVGANDTAPGNRTSVQVQARGTQLVAVEETMRVTAPDTGRIIRCDRRGGLTPGPGFVPEADVGYRAEPGQTSDNTPDGCWYKLTKSSGDPNASSLGTRGPTYFRVTATSHWKVWAKPAGGDWAPFTSLGGNEVEFEKTGLANLKVSEVQSINVLPDGVVS